MPHLLVFGLGYTANRLALALRGQGWTIDATGSSGNIAFIDERGVTAALARASHILSSVPPANGADPVLERYGSVLASSAGRWIGYLSSTGVYGDTKGAWVDESAPVGHGRRDARTRADLAWQSLGQPVHIFRLPGIYGPGRSALDRIKDGRARKIAVPNQVFSRIHVDDIVSGIIAGMDGLPGIYNLADDSPCPQNDVIDYGCNLLGREGLPLVSLSDAALTTAARAFYEENRRVSNLRAKRLLNWQPKHADYRSGLQACLAEDSKTHPSS